MVFQVKGRGPFKLRVLARSGARATLSTGMYTRADADDVEAMVERWEGKRGLQHARPAVLELLVSDRSPLSLKDAYLKALDGSLDAYMEELAAKSHALDLRPYLTQWHAEKQKAKRGAASADDYHKKLLVLYPETEPLTTATFTRKDVLKKLKALDVDEPTRNRYKAAASSFAWLLVDEEILEHNIVLTIPGFPENTARVVYYAMEDAKRLIAGLAQPYAGLAAYAAGFAAEWSAIERLLVGEVHLSADPVTARVQGQKRPWRDREVPLVPELAWTLDYLRPLLKDRLPNVKVFADLKEWTVIDRQRERATELGIQGANEDRFGPHSLHDWRHSHAVWLTRAGYPEQIVAAHLGHKNTDLVRKNYAVYKPDRHDYARVAATKSATDARVGSDVKVAK